MILKNSKAAGLYR